MLLKASDGDVAAAREVTDRLDGKPPIAVVGDSESPIAVSISRGEDARALIERKLAENSFSLCAGGTPLCPCLPARARVWGASRRGGERGRPRDQRSGLINWRTYDVWRGAVSGR